MVNKISGKRSPTEVKHLHVGDQEVTTVTDIADTLAESFSSISSTSNYTPEFQLHATDPLHTFYNKEVPIPKEKAKMTERRERERKKTKRDRDADNETDMEQNSPEILESNSYTDSKTTIKWLTAIYIYL